jgi:hypothetical protein
MLLAVDAALLEAAVWNGLSQLAVLGIVGFVANIVIRRFREVSSARQELLDAIDQFSIHLYKPRKLYQIMIDGQECLLPGVCDADQRDRRRLEALHEALRDFVDATGRLRTLQAKIIQLYGYDIDLLAHYLALWRYMKEVRRRMERGERLFAANEKPESADAFYRLFDSFRYRVSVARYVWRRPGVVEPPPRLVAAIRNAGDVLYKEFFGIATAETVTVHRDP